MKLWILVMEILYHFNIKKVWFKKFNTYFIPHNKSTYNSLKEYYAYPINNFRKFCNNATWEDCIETKDSASHELSELGKDFNGNPLMDHKFDGSCLIQFEGQLYKSGNFRHDMVEIWSLTDNVIKGNVEMSSIKLYKPQHPQS